MKKSNMCEFNASLSSYVGEDAEGTRKDLRDDLARKFVEIGASQLMSFDPEPWDLAAMFSHVVGVKDITSLPRLRSLRSKDLVTELAKLRATDDLPHVCRAGHPAEPFFSDLSSDVTCVTLYVEIISHLAEAREQMAIRSSLFIPGRVKGDAVKPAPLITASEDVAVGGEMSDADEDDVHGTDTEFEDEEEDR
jgi:hypothetical protein